MPAGSADRTRWGTFRAETANLHCPAPGTRTSGGPVHEARGGLATPDKKMWGAVKDEQLYAFVADARARNAADIRRRTRWLQHQLREDALFVELCRDLGSSGAPVELTLSDGRTHRGRLAGVGADVVAVMTLDGSTVYIATSAAVGVRAIAVAPSASSAEDHAVAVRDGQVFDDVLADLADLRLRVVVGTVPGRTYDGILAGVGRDIVWFDDNQWYLRSEMVTDVMVVR